MKLSLLDCTCLVSEFFSVGLLGQNVDLFQIAVLLRAELVVDGDVARPRERWMRLHDLVK